ncbi:MAG: hypothetical protein ACRDY7_17405, partial [Acidimicrobiia bacterium]
YEPAWSPDGKTIVFVSRRFEPEDSAELMLMDADGRNQRRFTTLDGYDDEPTWSPDGRWIAWRRNLDDPAGKEGDNPEIYKMEVGVPNAEPLNLTKDAFKGKEDLDDEPSWSADGTIAFRSDEGDGTTIWSMKDDGTDPVKLGTRYSDDPAFSPDGSKIAFRGSGAAGAWIWTMNPDGTAAERLPQAFVGAVDGIDPAWSPDSEHIAFVSRENPDAEERTGNGEIYVMGADGSDPENITNNPSFDGDPDWQALGASTTPTSDTTATTTPTTTTAPTLPGGGGTTSTTADPSPPTTGATADPARSGYWMLDAGGKVYPFGEARGHGDAHPPPGGAAVDFEPHPAGGGYWIVDGAGQIHHFGAARHFGHASPRLRPGERATSLSATPSGGGYWVFTDTGRALAFGDAVFQGDMDGIALNGPVLDSIPTPTGAGYYMVGSDGGIFTFGDADFHGSTGNMRLNAPVQSLVPDPDGTGYWLVASDGGVFSFAAEFRGSMGGVKLNKPVTGMVPYGNGYLMVAEDGGIFTFSDRPFSGSLGADPPALPVVSVGAMGQAR